MTTTTTPTTTTRTSDEPQPNLTDLENKSRQELQEIAQELGLSGYNTLKKHELLRLLQTNAERQERKEQRQGGNLFSGVILEVSDEVYGFLRG